MWKTFNTFSWKTLRAFTQKIYLLIYFIFYVKIICDKQIQQNGGNMKHEYLEGGRICTSHGVKGQLKAEHLCDSPRILLKIKTIYFKNKSGEYLPVAVKGASVMGQFVLLSLEGIETREEAITYRGRTFFLHRNDVPLPKGAMFIADMIGLPVIHAESGERLGELSDVSEVAGRRIYSVRTESGEVLLPDVPEFIKEISDEGIKVLPIPGFFDEADEV
jgi:16S rRNA processing protein RimM